MDRGFIRRQLYHMMFLESNENDIFETIAYNDAEYLNEWDGITSEYSRFAAAGVNVASGISFDKYLTMPNWFCTWLITYSLEKTAAKHTEQDEALAKLEKEMNASAVKDKPSPRSVGGHY